MKKILSFMLLAVMTVGFSTVFTSCSDDDDAFDYEMSQLVGTWVVSQVDTGSGYRTWPLQRTTATFNADGTYSGRGYFGTGSGTYRASGKTIITYISGEEYYRYDVLSLSGNTCELRMYMVGADEDLKLKCTKE